MERVIATSVAHLIATSSDEMLELVRMGVPRASVTVVPCGVDVDHFQAGGIAAGEGPPRVVSVGRLVERKGFDLLIRALRRVPEVELVIGGGGQETELENDPEARRLRALAPWYEPFGLVPLEAMSCGVPVLASAVGGHVDTIVDGVTGVLVPPRRPDLLAVALNRLLEDPVQRDAYGVAGADRARSRYSWDRIAADTTRVYEEMLGQRTGPPPTEVAELLH
jgi:D-inositol-3-phosphate glycosyltransferase